MSLSNLAWLAFDIAQPRPVQMCGTSLPSYHVRKAVPCTRSRYEYTHPLPSQWPHITEMPVQMPLPVSQGFICFTRTCLVVGIPAYRAVYLLHENVSVVSSQHRDVSHVNPASPIPWTYLGVGQVT